MVSKGSVAIDGVSLTIVDAGESTFSVSLIPHTLECTTLGALRAGSRVNVEVDHIAKLVFRYLDVLRSGGGGGLNRQTLEEFGFIPTS